jgi:sigma-B regulation protein RsbU (phosphoserine phosphatase)
MYGSERLSKILYTNPDHSAGQIADAIMGDVTRFQDGKDRFDDETIIVLKTR